MSEDPGHELAASEASPEPPPDSVGHGVAIGLGILAGHLLLLIPPLTLLAFFPGVIQWLVVLPLSVKWSRARRLESLKGLLVVAGLVSLANAACCGILLTDLK